LTLARAARRRTRAGRPAHGGRVALVGLALAGFALAGCGSGGAGSTSTAKSSASALVSIGAGLEGPAGLHASVYAKGPRTTAAFAFDHQGRLWVSAAGLETHSDDGVYMIAKVGAPALQVISRLDDPLGIVWDQGRLYVASVGRVDEYSDFNGKRFTHHHEILHGPAAGAENNLLVLAADGRLLMGITATCDHCRPSSQYAGSIVSFRPNGSDLRLYAGHIRAPFGLTYLPGTSNLFVTMNQQDNLGAQTPGDWLAAVAEGQDWRFPECHGQGTSACTGVPAPTAVLDKHAAVGGVAILTGQLGASIGTSAIVPEWNVAKVQRVALTRTSSGYRGTVTPFLTGLSNPLAITLGPNRALLVGDWATGTIYSITATSS
jgi:glucose/arabinose dehydrogenase